MPTTHPKINILEGGWYVVYQDDTVLTMTEVSGWREVPNKKDIKIMGLKCRHKQCELVEKDIWVAPGRTEMRELSMGFENTEIRVTTIPDIGWFIGYHDLENKCKVLIRASRITGKYTTEKLPYGQDTTAAG